MTSNRCTCMPGAWRSSGRTSSTGARRGRASTPGGARSWLAPPKLPSACRPPFARTWRSRSSCPRTPRPRLLTQDSLQAWSAAATLSEPAGSAARASSAASGGTSGSARHTLSGTCSLARLGTRPPALRCVPPWSRRHPASWRSLPGTWQMGAQRRMWAYDQGRRCWLKVAPGGRFHSSVAAEWTTRSAANSPRRSARSRSGAPTPRGWPSAAAARWPSGSSVLGRS
mmetsp:Transcript_58652/g.174544  ORF Transcript_58652/g.174544 Transcript_58652/m.174544 type:complete len:227 (+) Transcript_58652:527-1207(+)